MELATGTVVKSHGVRGDLVVDVRTDSPEERFAVGTTITSVSYTHLTLPTKA